MARLNILIALFSAALFLFVVHACASKEGEESCSKQLKNVNLKHCEKHIMKRIEKEEEGEEDVLTMRGTNYIWRRESEDEQKRKCCKQMSELNNPECQCRALQKIMDRKSKKLETKEMEDMERELMILPMRCGLGPLMGCELSWED
ncbi:Bifunctional inhibitor/plant lipid transfer protein/seed storage helical domain [Sesbania bispinosa]|nr:Bifunctional inhibitor/plant lipid transfer protein/seed storage helical domain [Sesbania bispinosa]